MTQSVYIPLFHNLTQNNGFNSYEVQMPYCSSMYYMGLELYVHAQQHTTKY